VEEQVFAAPAEGTDKIQPGDVVTAPIKYNTVINKFPFLTVQTSTVVWTISPTTTLPASVTATVTP
jgi:hypothetical protein